MGSNKNIRYTSTNTLRIASSWAGRDAIFAEDVQSLVAKPPNYYPYVSHRSGSTAPHDAKIGYTFE